MGGGAGMGGRLSAFKDQRLKRGQTLLQSHLSVCVCKQESQLREWAKQPYRQVLLT